MRFVLVMAVALILTACGSKSADSIKLPKRISIKAKVIEYQGDFPVPMIKTSLDGKESKKYTEPAERFVVEILKPENYTGSHLEIFKADKGMLLELETDELISFDIVDRYLEKKETDMIWFVTLSDFQRNNSNKARDQIAGTGDATD